MSMNYSSYVISVSKQSDEINEDTLTRKGRIVTPDYGVNLHTYMRAKTKKT